MSEFGWPTAEEPEKPEDDDKEAGKDKDKDTTKSSRKAKVAVSGKFVVGKEAAAGKQEKDQPKSEFDKLVDKLIGGDEEKAGDGPEKSEDSDGKKTDEGLQAETAEDNGGFEPLPGYERALTDLNVGEVVVRLDHEPRVEDATGRLIETSAEPIVWHRQPEQQHQASDEAAPAGPDPEESQTGGPEEAEPVSFEEPDESQPPVYEDLSVPEVPAPAVPPAAETHQEPERLEPAEAYRRYAQRQAAEAAIVLQQEQGVSKEELDDAIYRATKTGLGRGLATGLLVGGAYEHFKHKRREKKAAKNQREQTKKAERLQRDQNFTIQEQSRQYAEATTRLAGTERRLTETEQRLAAQAAAEKLLQQPGQEQLAVPPEHRVEHSAWHSIEVDAKTGKPVENPALAYGHEYYRERAAEATPPGQHGMPSGSAAVPAAVEESKVAMAGLLPGQEQGGTSPLPSSQIPNASMRGAPSVPGRPSGKQGDDSSAQTTRLWPYVVTLIIIVIILIAVLA